MNRLSITIIAALINQQAVEYIKFVVIDPATTTGKEKAALLKTISTITGFVLWLAVFGRLKDGKADMDDLYAAATTGTVSNMLHDASDIARQTAISAKRKITS